jgi:hypothetical protein
MTAVTRDQFEVYDDEVRHVPTDARFSVRGGETDWGRAGMQMPDASYFARKGVLHVAMQIIAEIADK